MKATIIVALLVVNAAYYAAAARLPAAHLPDLPTEDLTRRHQHVGSRRLAHKLTSETQSSGEAGSSAGPWSHRRLLVGADDLAAATAAAAAGTVQKEGRVAFGESVPREEYPFAAHIDGAFLCSGSLIAPRVVATAAHCVTDPFGEWISMDFINVKLGSTLNKGGDEYKVQMAVMPKYNSTSKRGDIALLLLDRASNSTPVALADATTALGAADHLTAIGWGQTEKGVFPDVLHRVALPTMSAENCTAAHAPMGDLPDDHFCAGE